MQRYVGQCWPLANGWAKTFSPNCSNLFLESGGIFAYRTLRQFQNLRSWPKSLMPSQTSDHITRLFSHNRPAHSVDAATEPAQGGISPPPHILCSRLPSNRAADQVYRRARPTRSASPNRPPPCFHLSAPASIWQRLHRAFQNARYQTCLPLQSRSSATRCRIRCIRPEAPRMFLRCLVVTTLVFAVAAKAAEPFDSWAPMIAKRPG
jgi:hypothetical protein